MRLLIIALSVLSINAFAGEEKPEVCILASQIVDFYRCQTKEVTCYLSKGQQTCWVNKQEAAPIPSPAASPAKSVNVKKK